MLLPVPTRFRRRRRVKVKSGAAPAPVPPGPILVLAMMVSSDPPVIRLGFDRSLEVSALDASAVSVMYPSGTGYEYVGDSLYDMPDGETIELLLAEVGAAPGGLDLLNAGADTGIVAVDDSAEWSGVSNLEVPFP